MARGGEQQQSGQDSSMDLLWIIAILIGVVILSWYFGKVYITSAVFHVRLYEVYALDLVLGSVTKLINFTGLPAPQFNLADWVVYLRKGIGVEISFEDMVTISTMVGDYLKYPLALLTVVGAAALHFGGASHLFRHVFDGKSLKTLEQEIWPQITPVVKLDLVKAKLDEGPWAFSPSPMRFCKKYDLLDIEERQGKYTALLKRGAAHRIFSLQVGPRWHGPDKLPIYTKALFAIFAARVNADRKGAEALIDHLSSTAGDGKPDFTGTEELLRKHAGSKKVGKIVSVHAYVTTVMASMLVGARGLGVIASAEFVWLKPIDRRMWYMLNSVGRATAVPEICGAFAHWVAEKKLGLPLTVPMVEEAVRGMEVELSAVIYKPDEKDE